MFKTITKPVQYNCGSDFERQVEDGRPIPSIVIGMCSGFKAAGD